MSENAAVDYRPFLSVVSDYTLSLAPVKQKNKQKKQKTICVHLIAGIPSCSLSPPPTTTTAPPGLLDTADVTI